MCLVIFAWHNYAKYLQNADFYFNKGVLGYDRTMLKSDLQTTQINKKEERMPLILLVILVFTLNGCDSQKSGFTTSDPGLIKSPIAYVKRPIPLNDNGNEIQNNLSNPVFFSQGGDVYVRDNSSAITSEKNITRLITNGLGDVKNLRPSSDGTRLLFALRLTDEDPNDNVIPAWNVYEYSFISNTLRPIISDALVAQEGNDIMPEYLPDGRIVFSSDRQRVAGELLTNEGKPRFKALGDDLNVASFFIHVMNSDGSEIKQISFNQSHDLFPIVLKQSLSGQILFVRWDNAERRGAFHLYKMNPDGTDVELVYGAHSHTDVNNMAFEFTRPEEMQDGRIMLIVKPETGTFDAGNTIMVDINSYVDNDVPIASLTGLQVLAQEFLTKNAINIGAGSISLAGRYQSSFPLWDGSGRVLVSKSFCQISINGILQLCNATNILDSNAVETYPTYSLWIYNPADDTEKVVVPAENGILITDVVALQSTGQATIIADDSSAKIDVQLQQEGLGIINIKSVYDMGGSFNKTSFTPPISSASVTTIDDLHNPQNYSMSQLPIRFARFIRPVSFAGEGDVLLPNPPDIANAAFGPNRSLLMREIVGYAPVQPDGSLKVKVPANMPLAIELLDANARRVSTRHVNWFSVKAGDTLQCTGCHTHNVQNGQTPLAHGRVEAEPVSLNSGIPASGVFTNTQIPGTVDLFFGNLGETMAEVLYRRVASFVPEIPEPIVSIDVRYTDFWTDTSVATANPAINYLYANLDAAMVKPRLNGCVPWTVTCRVAINYPQHIDPLWSLSRGVAGANTCTNCHAPIDSLAVAQVPAAQLDLTSSVSDQQNARITSYQELLANDQGQVIDGTGNLVNIQIPVPVFVLDNNGDIVLDLNGNPVQQVDNNGDPLFDMVDDPNAGVNPTVSANGARASYFIEKMTETELSANRTLSTLATDTTYIDHSSFMTPDELRLVSEWIDLGAQYFNDPFDAEVPVN